jgi:hypothetical protein
MTPFSGHQVNVFRFIERRSPLIEAALPLQRG